MEVSDLRSDIVSFDAQAAFDVLMEGFSRTPGFSIEAYKKEFLNSLRVRRGKDYCIAAIPNDCWVLAYVRKPEPLRGDYPGWWSRRIDREHRLVYRVLNGDLFIAQCRYHY